MKHKKIRQCEICGKEFTIKRGVTSILVNRIVIDEDGNAEIIWNI